MSRLALAFGLGLAALVAAAGPGRAEVTIPTQDGWVAARKSVTTPGGLEMTYVEMGSGEGTPLLLLHGYTDNSRSWSLLAPYLGQRRMIALDLRGHGGSEAPQCCYGVDTLADDVAGFMEVMEIDKADVIGHSLGSMTAATLAATHPDKVDQLVLISTAMTLPAGPLEWLQQNVPAQPDPIDPDSQFMKDWYWNPNPVPADFIDRERGESAATPRQTWLGVLDGLAKLDLNDVATKVTAPTLILWGDQDGFFDAASQETVRLAYPGAQYIAFPGHGHNMFWEDPEKVGHDITGFLTE